MMETYTARLDKTTLMVSEAHELAAVGSVEVLITRWPSGQASIATRPSGQRTWGPPTPLDRVEWPDE